jgi:uncharacterized membrane protein YvbJ
MSEPEIARRCSACGASVREHAAFCPQCGNPIAQTAAITTTTPVIKETIVDTPAAPTVHHEGVRGRVENIRKVSSVLIDQAAYDPSLRFLLVAAAFFILFIVLLIASKVIG